MAQTLTSPSPDLKIILKNGDVLCVYGGADAALYRALKSWLSASDDHYAIFVDDDEHRFLQAKQLPLAKDPKVRVLYYAEADEGIFSAIAWEFIFLKMSYFPSTDPKAAQFFKQLEHFQHAATLLASDGQDMGERVLSNLIANLPFLDHSVQGNSLKDACKDMPALICGAGPSLDKLASFFPAFKERALIIAAGTATTALNEQGIMPHLFAYLDPHPPRDRFLRQKTFETALFYQSRFSSQLLSRTHSSRIWMSGTGNYPIEKWLEEECGIESPRGESGWTVATFAVSIALHLGCNPILLAGMDFCCHPDAIYASGLKGEENREQLISFEDEQGELRHSKRDWLMSGEWIAEQARVHPERRWVNLSDGIPIGNIEKKGIDETLASLDLPYDIEGHLFAALAQAERIAISEEKAQLCKDKLKSSFEKCGLLNDNLLSFWEKTFPHSPAASPEYALVEIDLDTEAAAHHFIQPLWEMWKHSILRHETHPFGKVLHRLLFYKKAVDTALKVFS
jgi:hypothetical protein